jgi:hypothetical protein
VSGSYDDVDFSRHDDEFVPISCDKCAGEPSPLGGFIFDSANLRKCQKCGKEGCVHWCDGAKPCEWCVNGIPDGYSEKPEDPEKEGEEWKP